MAPDVDPTETPDRPEQPCVACRGTGEVISALGGEPRKVPCPWCKGTGRRIPGHDAQAHWRDEPNPAA